MQWLGRTFSINFAKQTYSLIKTKQNDLFVWLNTLIICCMIAKQALKSSCITHSV